MDEEPNLPISISYVGSKYLLFDIEAATWLRRVHRVCGLTTGTLPQGPSQNVFLGLPLHLMPEEAQLLVEKGVCYIFDDAEAHEDVLAESEDSFSSPLLDKTSSRHLEYMKSILDQGQEVTRKRDEENENVRRQKQPKANAEAKSKAKSDMKPADGAPNPRHPTSDSEIRQTQQEVPDADADNFLFENSSTAKKRDTTAQTKKSLPHGIVPTTSKFWLPPNLPPIFSHHDHIVTTAAGAAVDEITKDHLPPLQSLPLLLPHVPPTSYPLYKHLNSLGYYMTPGLRFGSQYSVYPGDPLRFHSHFLAVGKSWDEAIDLMTLVGGGRLGTGVKKGFLIGGEEPQRHHNVRDDERGVTNGSEAEVDGGMGGGEKMESGDDSDHSGVQKERRNEPRVRTFSFEWAYM